MVSRVGTQPIIERVRRALNTASWTPTGAIAERLGVARSSVSHALNDLEAAGEVDRMNVPSLSQRGRGGRGRVEPECEWRRRQPCASRS